MSMAIAGLIGYFFGSIPSGVLLTYLSGLPDPRRIGSGNIGATNVLRTGHRGLAALTLIADMGKGIAAVLIVQTLFHPTIGLIAALGAVIGHMFPLWLKFRGGKGVATAIGVILVLWWPSRGRGLRRLDRHSRRHSLFLSRFLDQPGTQSGRRPLFLSTMDAIVLSC